VPPHPALIGPPATFAPRTDASAGVRSILPGRRAVEPYVVRGAVPGSTSPGSAEPRPIPWASSTPIERSRFEPGTAGGRGVCSRAVVIVRHTSVDVASLRSSRRQDPVAEGPVAGPRRRADRRAPGRGGPGFSLTGIGTGRVRHAGSLNADQDASGRSRFILSTHGRIPERDGSVPTPALRPVGSIDPARGISRSPQGREHRGRRPDGDESRKRNPFRPYFPASCPQGAGSRAGPGGHSGQPLLTPRQIAPWPVEQVLVYCGDVIEDKSPA
jgi:hypothetical protein